MENPQGSQALRYWLGFAERGQRFELVEERIENEQSDEGHEEPYIFHPDILSTVSKLLLEASERSQLIVTTHSDMLVDALTNEWWSIVVCEKRDGQTAMRRLDEETR